MHRGERQSRVHSLLGKRTATNGSLERFDRKIGIVMVVRFQAKVVREPGVHRFTSTLAQSKEDLVVARGNPSGTGIRRAATLAVMNDHGRIEALDRRRAN